MHLHLKLVSERTISTLLIGLASALVLTGLAITTPSSDVQAAGVSGVGIFSPRLKPQEASVRSRRPAAVGVQFASAAPGTVSAIRYFRSARNKGPHVVRLWGPGGRLLSQGRYDGRRTGWVTVRLAREVSIVAGRRYVASYVAPHGRYSRTRHSLSATHPTTSHGLSAYAGVRGPRGGMPTRAGTANFFVDVVFEPAVTPPGTPPPSTTTPPTPSTTPTPGPGGSELDLPRVAWEGGSAYWSRFPKAHQSRWDSPTFFPISVFYGKPEHAAQLKALGINTYMGAEHDGTPLTAITNQGMFVLAQQEEFTPAEVGNNAGVVGWFISDECEMGYSGCPEDEQGSLAQQRRYVTKVDGYADGRFKEANFGNGVLRTWWAPQTMDDHVQLMDAASADKYTYTSPHVWDIVTDSPDWPKGAPVPRAASYGWQVDQMKRFQDRAHLRPIWAFVETAQPLLDESGARTITPDQLEGAVWSAIIHEARGVAFFQHNNNGSCGNYSLIDCGPALRAKVTALTAQIRTLAPVINSQSYAYDFENGTDTMLKTYDGAAYVFAGLGLLDPTGSKTFRLPPGVSGTSVTVVGENRTIPVVNGSFTDSFAAEYSHHVYRVGL